MLTVSYCTSTCQGHHGIKQDTVFSPTFVWTITFSMQISNDFHMRSLMGNCFRCQLRNFSGRLMSLESPRSTFTLSRPWGEGNRGDISGFCSGTLWSVLAGTSRRKGLFRMVKPMDILYQDYICCFASYGKTYGMFPTCDYQTKPKDTCSTWCLLRFAFQTSVAEPQLLFCCSIFWFGVVLFCWLSSLLSNLSIRMTW